MNRDTRPASMWPLFLPLLIYPFFFTHTDRRPISHEMAHYYLTRAIVENQSFKITEQIKALGDIGDKATFEGEAYALGAPGLAVLSVPAFALAEAVASVSHHEVSMRASLRWLRFAMVQLPTAFFLIWMFSFLLRRGLQGQAVRYAILAYGLSVPAGIYATLFMGEQLAAVALALAFLLLSDDEDWPTARTFATSGVLAGIALFTSYAAIPAVALLCGYALSRARDPRWFLPFLGAVALFLIALGGYHYACFAHPAHVALRYAADPAVQKAFSHSIFGLSAPSLHAFFQLLFGSGVGLVGFAPFYVLALIGFVVMISRGEVGEALFIGASVLLLLFLVSGLAHWQGGGGVGPRYLVPVLALLVWPLARAVEELSAIAGGALIAGVLGVFALAVFGCVAVSYPIFPEHYTNGLRDLSWFLLRDGVLAANLGQKLGFSGLWSALPFAVLLGLAGLVVAYGGLSAREVPAALRAGVVACLASALFWWRLSWAPEVDRPTRYKETLAIERAVETGEANGTAFSSRAQASKDDKSKERWLSEGQLFTSVGDLPRALEAYRRYFAAGP